MGFLGFLNGCIEFCAMLCTIMNFSRDGWRSTTGWESLAAYAGCAAFAAFRRALIAAADRKRAAAQRAYDVAVVRDGVLAAREALY